MYYKTNKYKKNYNKNKKNLILFLILILISIIIIYFIYNYSLNTYSQLKKLIEQKKFLKAENLINKKLKKEKFNPLLFYYEGYLYFNKKDFFNSLISFKKALFFINEYNNIPQDIFYYVGYCYYYLGKDYYYYSYKYLNLFIENNKNKKIDSFLYYTLGVIEVNLEKYKEAYNHLIKAYKDYKNDINFLYYYSISLKNNGYSNEAINILLNIINNTSDIELLKSCYYLIGKIYYEFNNYSESQKYFYKVLEINPNSSDTLYYLGLIEFNNKNYLASKNFILKSLVYNPNNKNSIELLNNLNKLGK